MARTKTVVRDASELTESEYNQCRSLNFREKGFMREDVAKARRKNTGAKVIMIKDEQDRLLAWSLAQPQNPGYLVYFYVRVSERGRGLGSRLMRQAKKLDPVPFVVPGDTTSGKFFKKFEDSIRVDDCYKFWLK